MRQALHNFNTGRMLFMLLLALPICINPVKAQTDLIHIQAYTSAFDYITLDLLASARFSQTQNSSKPDSSTRIDPMVQIENLAAGNSEDAKTALDSFLASAELNSPQTTWQHLVQWAVCAAWMQQHAALKTLLTQAKTRAGSQSQQPGLNMQNNTLEDLALGMALAQRDAGDLENARRSLNALLQVGPGNTAGDYRMRRLHLQAAKVELLLKNHDNALNHLSQINRWYRSDKQEDARDLPEPDLPEDIAAKLLSYPNQLQYLQGLCLEAELHLSLFYLETHDVRNLLRADRLYARARSYFSRLRHSPHAITFFPQLQEIGEPLFARALGVAYLAYQETGLETHAHACFSTAEERKYFNYWRAALQTMPLKMHAELPLQLQTYQVLALELSNTLFSSQGDPASGDLGDRFELQQNLLMEAPQYHRIFSRKSPPSIRAVFDEMDEASLFLHFSIAEGHIFTARFFEEKYSIRRTRFTDKLGSAIEIAYNSMRSGKTDNLPESLRTLFQALLAQHVHPDQKRMQHLLVSPDSTLFSIPFEALATRMDSRRDKPGDFSDLSFAAARMTVEYLYCAADIVGALPDIDADDVTIQLVSPAPEETQTESLTCEGITLPMQAAALSSRLGSQASSRFLTSSGAPRSLRYTPREIQAILDQAEAGDAAINSFLGCEASLSNLDNQSDADTRLGIFLANTNFGVQAAQLSGMLLAADQADFSGFLPLRLFSGSAPDADVLAFPYTDLRRNGLPDAISVGAFLSCVQTRTSGLTTFSLWNASTAFSFEFLQALVASAHQASNVSESLTDTRRKFIAQERLAHPLRWARMVVYRY